MDVEGDGKLREGVWWIGTTLDKSKLKTKVWRWLDFLNMLGGVSMKNDEIGEGLSESEE